MSVVGSRAGRPAVILSRFRLDRLPGARSAVRLRFVLSSPARVRFLIIGPAPSCQAAGRFVLAGHRGLNRLAFRGRVRGRLLGPGTYTIVPQPASGSSRHAKAVAVVIDARGIRPTAPVRWRNCDAAVATAAASHGLPASVTPRSGVAAAEALATETRGKAAEKRPSSASSWLATSGQKSSLLAALLLALLAVSIALLTIAWVEPGDTTMRFRAAGVIVLHRPEIARLGGAFLVSAVLLFLLTQV
jgi:hypothetical protein